MAKVYIDGKWTTTLARKAEKKAAARTAANAVMSKPTPFSPPLVAAAISSLSRRNMASSTAVSFKLAPSASFSSKIAAAVATVLQTNVATPTSPPSITTSPAFLPSAYSSSISDAPNRTLTIQDAKNRVDKNIQLLEHLYRGLETDYFKLSGRFTTNISLSSPNIAEFKKAKYQDADFLFDLQDEIAETSTVAANRTALWNKEDIKGKGVDRPGAREGVLAAELREVKALIGKYLKVRNNLKQLRETLENLNKGSSGVCKYNPPAEWKVIGESDTIICVNGSLESENLIYDLNLLGASPIVEDTVTVPAVNARKVRATTSKSSAIDSSASKTRFVPSRNKKPRGKPLKIEPPVKDSKVSKKKKVLPKKSPVTARVTRPRLTITHKQFTVDDGPYQNSSIDATPAVAHSSYLQHVIDPDLTNQGLWETKYTKLEMPEHLKHLKE